MSNHHRATLRWLLAALALLLTSPAAQAYYSPTTGRWLNRDPAGYVDGENLYQYAEGTPASRLDPSGLGWICSRPLELRLPQMDYPVTTMGPVIRTPAITVRPWKVRPPLIEGSIFQWDILHEHIFFETDSDGDGVPDNAGFFKEGVREDDPAEHGLYGDCVFYPNDDALKEAVRLCAQSPRFSAGRYGFMNAGKDNNCQSFAHCVRQKYHELTHDKKMSKWEWVEERERYTPHPLFPGYGHKPKRGRWVKREWVEPRQFDPMDSRPDPGMP